MTKRFCVVLAAGQGTRMKSDLYKVLHPVAGKPMVQHVVDQLQSVHLDEIVTIVGFGSEQVKEQIGSQSKFVIQKEQLGTGHAVKQAENVLNSYAGTTIVVSGDTPLITSETYQALLEHHEQSGAKATVLTTNAPDPTGYGRVIRNQAGEVEKIVEHKDANATERQVNEINTGTYCFDNQTLFQSLQEVSNDNAQGEYYLPDVMEIIRDRGQTVSAYLTSDYEETLGVNDRVALSHAEKAMKKRINERHMRGGATIADPDNTYIGPDVTIGQDVVIYPGSVINGATVIEDQAIIGPNTEITDCHVGRETVVNHSVAKESSIGERVQVGPYAHIRPEAQIGNAVKIGNFVEVKKSTIGTNSKVSHLSYIGDADLGNNVNVGCGTVTVNYDGNNKYLTTIEDDAFIGCNSNLIAPVTVGEGSFIAAGSTITKEVPQESLAVARARQSNKEGYANKLKGKQND